MEEIKFKNMYEGEYMISELIKGDNGCYTHFEYNSLYDGGTNTTLLVITYNPVNKTHFILHQLNGSNGMDALKKMYNQLYLKLNLGIK